MAKDDADEDPDFSPGLDLNIKDDARLTMIVLARISLR